MFLALLHYLMDKVVALSFFCGLRFVVKRSCHVIVVRYLILLFIEAMNMEEFIFFVLF